MAGRLWRDLVRQVKIKLLVQLAAPLGVGRLLVLVAEPAGRPVDAGAGLRIAELLLYLLHERGFIPVTKGFFDRLEVVALLTSAAVQNWA